MPVIDLTGRSLHYLYSSWLSVTPHALQTLLNQFSNFVGCLSCNHGTDEQMLSTPEHVQPHALQTLLNQFSNFVGCLSCNNGTDEQMLSTPEHVQPIQ